MTGTIVQLAPATQSGVIRAEDGSRVLFSASAVAGGFDTLALGGRVRFDCDRACSQVTAVRALPEPALSDAPLDLRYVGFDQAQNVRHYKFDAIARGQSTRRFVITANMALFLKHRVAMQDGPALCLRKLLSDLETSPSSSRHELSDGDLLAHAAARAAALERKARPSRALIDRHRHGPPPPGPWRRPLAPH